MNPVDVDEGGTVDAEELCGIEAALEIGNGLIDAVTAPVDHGEGEFILRGEVRDVIKR